jgi:exodeoxyribonuclease VII large subunit
MQEKTYSLVELTRHISRVFQQNFDTPYWIRAEISEIRENPSGHCYLELIEKDKNTDNIIARMRANIWATTYRYVKSCFTDATGQQLKAGMNILVAVIPEFHDVFSISLNIKDIDPSYTLGEMAQRRIEIIRKLEADGIMEMNKSLIFPVLPRKIAVISSATAAGYDDFCNQLKNNSGGYIFYPVLFQAIMQGDQAEASIIHALERIFEYAELFEVVVIIRGGGATADLSCFDTYEPAFACAQFPLPILTGIGHQRDNTILDMVAHLSLKTPTAVAGHLLERMEKADAKLSDIQQGIIDYLTTISETGRQYLENYRWKIKSVLDQHKTTKITRLERISAGLKSAVRLNLMHQQNKINLMEKSAEQHSPAFLLKFGYTITTINGKKITGIEQVKNGDEIRTYTADGSIISVVENTEKA